MLNSYGKIKDLRDFYIKSLRTAKALKLEKFAGIPAYEKEHQILNYNIDYMIAQIEVLNKLIDRQHLEESDQQHRGERPGCKQS
ncbi:hypothetical protein [Endozoicomonas sp. SCSIO W0465]|uniref:hypothetical protein n=1 Tax=Endozoicomonas sp. SCSIO W0465 TaxID=2918516 RepID=UPI002074DFB7|nr:hypothetical protein [Endozoicomonas sp. SCSIO W0465]USE38531.1 hypothetical protein MJO57_10380 [Endozoicomonas sp. SCSIO W0465]